MKSKEDLKNELCIHMIYEICLKITVKKANLVSWVKCGDIVCLLISHRMTHFANFFVFIIFWREE